MAANMLPILALGAAALLLMKKGGGGANGGTTAGGNEDGASNDGPATVGSDEGLPNFYDLSAFASGEIPPAMAKKLEDEINARGDRSFILLTDKKDPEKLAAMRQRVAWAAAHRKNVSFLLADCSAWHGVFPNGCVDAWDWAFGDPKEKPGSETRGTSGDFEQALKDIVETGTTG